MLLTTVPRLTLDAPRADPATIRETIEHEIRDIGYPRMALLPTAPFALPEQVWNDMGEASVRLLGLVKRALVESGASSRERLIALGADPAFYPLLTDDIEYEDGCADVFCRPDIILTESGPRFIELNVGGGFAGVVETHCRINAWKRLYADAATSRMLDAHDPLKGRARYFAGFAEEHGYPAGVAIVGTIKESVRPTHSTRYFDLDVDCLRAAGLEADFFDLEEMTHLRSSLSDQEYSLGYLHINPTDVLGLGLDLRGAVEARKSVTFLASQTGIMLGNKTILAWLSAGMSWMNDDDRAFVDEYVPWTRVLQDREEIHDGRRVRLIPWALENKDRLVVKRGFGGSANAVVLGSKCTKADWRTVVMQAVADGGWVLQERLEARVLTAVILPNLDAQVLSARVSPLFSPFIFGNEHVGMYARFSKNLDGGIISVHGSGSSDNVVVPIPTMPDRQEENK